MLKLRTVIKNLASSPSVVTIMLPEEGSGMKMSERGISKG
jgi:hypothetical protein